MSSFKQTDIISIYNSRKTIVDIYNSEFLSDYEYFNINEVEAMAKNNQLDMLFDDKKYDSSLPKSYKVYVKYMLVSRFQFNDVSNLVEDLFELESVLTKSDTLVIIVNDEPNDSLVTKLTHLYDTRGIFVVVHNIKRLQRNILKHTLVPKHTLVHDIAFKDGSEFGKEIDTDKNSISDLERVKQKYNLKNLSQLPEISRFDPVALLINLRPGQVCKIERPSITSIKTDYYRVCV
jgi:DNA-directed RNA polymerase subunit H (RpoH/RPB5)